MDITRPNYYQGQFLGAQDFNDELAYHRDMRRRHNLGPHTWGIVVGLELVEKPKESGTGVDVFLQPGMAVDGYGREIIVLHPTNSAPPISCASPPTTTTTSGSPTTKPRPAAPPAATNCATPITSSTGCKRAFACLLNPPCPSPMASSSTGSS